MSGHPNVDLIRRVHAAFDTGDMDTLAGFFAENVVWHTPGHNVLSGTYTGRDATFASFEKEFELSGGTYAAKLHDVLANDDHAVFIGRATAQRDGHELSTDYAILFHVSDGLITEAWELYADPDAFDSFWS